MDWIKRLHYLNIDTGIGAVVMSYFLAKLFEVTLDPYISIALFIAVLIIYTFDHYQDSFRPNIERSSERMKFYLAHRKQLKVFLVILVIDLFISLFFISGALIVNGAILSVAVGVYFILLKLIPLKDIFFKEAYVAVVYSLGIFLPAYTIGQLSLNHDSILLLIVLVIIAFMNLLVFSHYDRESDKMTMQPNFFVRIGNTGQSIVSILLCISNLIIIWWFLSSLLSQTDRLVLTLMTFILVTLLLVPVNKSSSIERMRVIGESVFLLPLVAL